MDTEVASWTQTSSYTNVAIVAPVECCSAVNVYLTNSIGPGTTEANEIASVIGAVPSGKAFFTGPLAGSLSTYYLTISMTDPTQYGGWLTSNPAIVTTGAGVTANESLIAGVAQAGFVSQFLCSRVNDLSLTRPS